MEIALSPRLSQLLFEAQSLAPHIPVQFRSMRDKETPVPNPAVVVTEPDGTTVIYLDEPNVDEHVIAHELMHVILHRSGSPQMFSLIHGDGFAKDIADSLDNIFDHAIFYPRIIDMGVVVSGYRNGFVEDFTKWGTPDASRVARLQDAFRILEGLLMGPPYRSRTIALLRDKRPKTLHLARELELLVNRRGSTRPSVRKAMVAALTFIEDWFRKETGSSSQLPIRIGISPVLKESQLFLPTSEVLDFVSEGMTLFGDPIWVGSLVLKADGTRIRSYKAFGSSEHPGVQDKRVAWSQSHLGDFLRAEHIKYGVL